MKAVIFAGGKGTRLAEETATKPKPMVEIGGMPILWHIMKIYSSHGINDFVICLGHKGYQIKEWFVNQTLHRSDITVDLDSGKIDVHRRTGEKWKVTLVDTGEDSLTATRLKIAAPYLDKDEDFCLTYGDGVADIDLTSVLQYHKDHGKEATVTVVQPPGRFGAVNMTTDNEVLGFVEKPVGDGGWINAGFFILSSKVLARLPAHDCMWEEAPIDSLTKDLELKSWRHEGFWMPMDTLREKHKLEQLWDSGKAPWKVWKD